MTNECVEHGPLQPGATCGCEAPTLIVVDPCELVRTPWDTKPDQIGAIHSCVVFNTRTRASQHRPPYTSFDLTCMCYVLEYHRERTGRSYTWSSDFASGEAPNLEEAKYAALLSACASRRADSPNAGAGA